MKNAFIAGIFMLIPFAGTAQILDDIPLEPVREVEHTVIYHQPGRFAAWPANNGIWQFEQDEILVGFTEAEYRRTSGHNAVGPYRSWLARSRNGGDDWTFYDPENYAGDFGDQPESGRLSKPVQFDHPDFAMRIAGTGYHGNDDPRAHFFVSTNRGSSWQGPYTFGDINSHPEILKYNLTELTPRTDYIVTAQNECLIFMSAREPGVFGSDRLFCVRTADGGMTFNFHGWVIRPYRKEESEDQVKVCLFDDVSRNPYAGECRAVMSASLKMPDGTLITVMRRRYDKDGATFNWVDAYSSADGGRNWSFLSYVANTGHGNGNPPAIALLADGRLCVVYGERTHGTMRAVLSEDGGKSWSRPQIVMDNFWSEDMEYDDMGYPRLVQRKDGKLVAVYYYSTKEHLHHLRASVWVP